MTFHNFEIDCNYKWESVIIWLKIQVNNPLLFSLLFTGSPPSPAIYSNLEYSIETTITPVFSTLGKQFRVVTNDTVVLPCEVVNAGEFPFPNLSTLHYIRNTSEVKCDRALSCRINTWFIRDVKLKTPFSNSQDCTRNF